MPFLVKNRTPSLAPGCFRLDGIPYVIQTAKQKRESIERSFVNEPLPHANKEREWLISADICLRTERNSSSFIATESFVSGRLFCFASKGLNSIATAFRICTCTNETEFAERFNGSQNMEDELSADRGTVRTLFQFPRFLHVENKNWRKNHKREQPKPEAGVNVQKNNPHKNCNLQKKRPKKSLSRRSPTDHKVQLRSQRMLNNENIYTTQK